MEKEPKKERKEDYLLATEEEEDIEERVLAELGITREYFPVDVFHFARKFAGVEKSSAQEVNNPNETYENAYKAYLKNYAANTEAEREVLENLELTQEDVPQEILHEARKLASEQRKTVTKNEDPTYLYKTALQAYLKHCLENKTIKKKIKKLPKEDSR